MRRIAAIVCACALVLGAPNAVAAGAKKYQGDFSGAGKLSFKVEKRQDGKKVVRFKFEDLLVTCGGVPKVTAGSLTYAVSVDKNKFSTEAVSGDPNDPKSKLVLKGELKKANASGTLHVFGSEVNVGGDPPERDECDSGTVNWDAVR